MDKPTEGLWARGTLAPDLRGRRLIFGIERYYLNENDPLKNALSGSVLAKVHPDRNYGLRINGLVRRH